MAYCDDSLPPPCAPPERAKEYDVVKASGDGAIVRLQDLSMRFDGVLALSHVSLDVYAGQVTCLLGDNGAGKSTLIKILSGVHQPTTGELWVEGVRTRFASPREAQSAGIATVHQDIGTLPLMSVSRNFFLGREITRGRGPFRRLDKKRSNVAAVEQLRSIGITRIHNGNQLVGTMSGGERQALAISRALYFGARVLVLDEPTSALGIKEAAIVLRLVEKAKADGIAVIFITHNAQHAIAVGDKFTVLIHGTVAATFERGERTGEEILNLMAGGEELAELEQEFARAKSDSPI